MLADGPGARIGAAIPPSPLRTTVPSLKQRNRRAQPSGPTQNEFVIGDSADHELVLAHLLKSVARVEPQSLVVLAPDADQDGPGAEPLERLLQKRAAQPCPLRPSTHIEALQLSVAGLGC